MLNERSNKALVGVNEKLVKIVKRADEITSVPFIVTEGLRTLERQKQLFAKGASKTMASKHLVGRAVDLAPVLDGEVRWDWPLFTKLNNAMQQAAKEQGIVLVWGGDWKSFRDGPHWQLGEKE